MDKEQFYILASSLADEQKRVLKCDETFAIFDKHGDIRPFNFEDHGVFHQGTRYLSHLSLKIASEPPLLLSSSVRDDNDLYIADMTNCDFSDQEGRKVHNGTLHIGRQFFMRQGLCYQKIEISNYGLEPVDFALSLEFAADYIDLFELRGMKREKRGEILPPETDSTFVALSYKGLDGKVRKTAIEFSPQPAALTTEKAEYRFSLATHEKRTLLMKISCDGGAPQRDGLEKEFFDAKKGPTWRHHHHTSISTSNEYCNNWICRSTADLHMMLTKTDHGLYPFAGIPWYCTVFGRDGIITALQMLWIYPEVAKGVLDYLAFRQAKKTVAEQDAEPGKILHEERKGEMAELGEIPFKEYYGTIDATPLFVILAAAYFKRTADIKTIVRLWKPIEKALGWMDESGDIDKDGFLEYASKTEGGLQNQGWKDSFDSVFHKEGSLAEAPIALCEVQGYAYAAKEAAAELAELIGHKESAKKWREEAERLRLKFREAFWCPEIGAYALALDGKKRRCEVLASNAGQCLFTGIADKEHAAIIAGHLMSEEFFSGWGVRTLAKKEARYNPMAYHNGSIWPHDNALIALGLAKYGHKEAVLKIFKGLFEASLYMEMHRLPELYCGFSRREGEGPTLYPVACDPQAWASGSAFMLLEASLGMEIDAPNGKLIFNNPQLPDFLENVVITNLKIGKATIDIEFNRYQKDVGINILKKSGAIELVTLK